MLVGMRQRSPSVYIMASGHYGTLYTGATSDLVARVIQHREGVFDGFTKEYDVKRLVWFDSAGTLADAFIAEKRIKRWRRDWKIVLIERDNPHWEDLAVSRLGLPPLR